MILWHPLSDELILYIQHPVCDSKRIKEFDSAEYTAHIQYSLSSLRRDWHRSVQTNNVTITEAMEKENIEKVCQLRVDLVVVFRASNM